MGSDDPGIDAAARVIHEAGCSHRWWGFDKPYDEVDPICKEEFTGIIRRALEAADAARQNVTELAKNHGLKIQSEPPPE